VSSARRNQQTVASRPCLRSPTRFNRFSRLFPYAAQRRRETSDLRKWIQLSVLADERVSTSVRNHSGDWSGESAATQ
jgi:hypothetical protein